MEQSLVTEMPEDEQNESRGDVDSVADNEYLDEEYLNPEFQIFDKDYHVVCNICNCSIENSNLQKHMVANHFNHECPECDKKYYTAALLRKHLRCAHLTSMNLSCPICGAVLCKKYNLQQHILTHSSNPLFTCSYNNCDKKFRHINSLKQHEKIHEMRNRRQCPICRAFVTRLKIHILTHSHSDERPFKCDKCSKSFLSDQFLKSHMVSHTGKEFNCDICDSRYKSKSGLSKHQKTVHTSNLYPCPICDKKYNRRDNMTSHLKKAHSNEHSEAAPANLK